MCIFLVRSAAGKWKISLFIYTKKFSSLYEVDGKKDGDIKRKFGRGVMLISGARDLPSRFSFEPGE